MKKYQSPEEFQSDMLAIRKSGQRIGFVPTMGNLHEGHLSLMRIARKNSDVVVSSIFVNPLQFGPNEDFATYPRTLEKDLAGLQTEGVDAVFMPTEETMYPSEFQTRVVPGELSRFLCGQYRPGFFGGVCTVVTKLLQLSQCHSVVLGEKDFQQLMILKQCIRDLAMPVEVYAAPIAREPDGLAMSSRNSKIAKDKRESASSLFQTLRWAAEQVREGSTSDWSAIRKEAAGRIARGGFDSTQYFDLCSESQLEPLSEIPVDLAGLRIFVAAYLSGVRLIDNLSVQA